MAARRTIKRIVKLWDANNMKLIYTQIAFTPGNRGSDTYYARGRPGGDGDVVTKRNVSSPMPEIKPVTQFTTNHFSDWAMPLSSQMAKGKFIAVASLNEARGVEPTFSLLQNYGQSQLPKRCTLIFVLRKWPVQMGHVCWKYVRRKNWAN